MRDMDYSRPLDVHRFSDYPEVDEWIDAFWDEHLEPYFPDSPDKRGPKSKSTPKRMFKVLFLDLYVAWLEDPNLCLGVSRTDSAYKVNTRYNRLHISKKIIGVIDALLELGFLDQKLRVEGLHRVTRVWPLNPLVECFKTAAFSEFLIDVHHDKECIVLNDKVVTYDADEEEIEKTISVEYEDTDAPFDLPKARQQLQSYNALLRSTFVDVGSEEKPVVIREYFNRKTERFEERRISLRHDNKFVRRIFYRGDWDLGGRYHGGWWQQIPSELRKDILINDEHTVEVDYSGFHVALAYGLESLQPPEDPYTLKELFEPLTAKQQRSDVKLLALTSINAKDRESAFKAFRQEKNKEQRFLTAEQKISYPDVLLNKLLNRFITENQSIEHYLCTDKGVELMALDGRITTHIINHFTNKQIPILTVHDSYVVQSQYEQELMGQMVIATQNEIGDYVFKKKQEKISPHMVLSFNRMDKSFDIVKGFENVQASMTKTKGYKFRAEKFMRFITDRGLSLPAPN